MMNILHFSQSVKWSSWFICSLLLHGLIFLAFIWRFSEVQPAMSPAPAIMLQWAEIIEAPSSPLSLPVGIAQQESAVTEEKQQTEDRQQRPVTEDSDATIEITRKKKSSDGEKKKTRPPRKIKAQTSDSNPTAVSSNAAPQALVESSRIAAPFNSDSTKRDNSEASWESRVKGHLNYTRNRITGYKPACDSRVICVPQGSYDIDDKEGGFNPSVQLSAQVTPWLQPFIGYSKSMRAPNIQEMFFSNSGGASMNPFLKPERAETWQAGFNIDTRDLLVEQDALRFKALAYRSRIQNYIYSESYLVCSGGRKCSLPEVIGNGWEGISDEYSDNMYIYVNSASDVIAKGFELEMDYDAGFAFGRLSFSQQQTDQPTSIASTHFGAGDITELPRKYMTLDTGVRFFDNALTLGTIIKYTGKARRLSPDFEQDEHTGAIIKQDLPQIPTIIDLYGTYEYNRNLTLKLSVQNLMNRDYSEALNKLNMMPGLGDETHPANSARGRTWIFGGDIRF